MKFYSFYICLLILGGKNIQAQGSLIPIELSPGIELGFPQNPDRIDTLGQKVFVYDDQYGFYSCIVQKINISPEKMANLNLSEFYSELFGKLMNPVEGCKLIEKKEIIVSDVRGMEFYHQCLPNQETPNIRYKRLFLKGASLYILDYWTKMENLTQARPRKDLFYNSLRFIQPKNKTEDIPIIPSPTAGLAGEPSPINYSSYFGLASVVLGLILAFIFLRKKPALKAKK